jgi:hypothetical protein
MTYFLSLIRGGNFTSSNGPNWLVRNNHIAPVTDLLCKTSSISLNFHMVPIFLTWQIEDKAQNQH